MSFFNPTTLVPATVEDGNTVGISASLEGLRAFGVVVPAIAGANLTFEVSADGTTWHSLYKNDNTQLSLAVTDSTFIGFGDLIPYFAPWAYVRITTDVAASGADEEFEIAVRDL